MIGDLRLREEVVVDRYLGYTASEPGIKGHRADIKRRIVSCGRDAILTHAAGSAMDGVVPLDAIYPNGNATRISGRAAGGRGKQIVLTYHVVPFVGLK